MTIGVLAAVSGVGRWLMKRAFPLILAIVLGACGRSPVSDEHGPPAPVVRVPVVTVEKQTVRVPYEAVGTVCAKVASTLQSKVVGHVLAVGVAEGDHVETGQTLVEIDASEAGTRIQQAESALREAQEAGREVEQAVQASVNAKNAAEASHELAAATFERFKDLDAHQAVSRQAFDEASARVKQAAADLARAADMVQSAQAKRREAAARVGQAEAELANARVLLGFTKVVAPFSGVVTRKSVETGDLAAPGSPLLVLEDPRLYRLEAQVDAEHIQGIAPGTRVPVMLDGFGQRALDGSVAEIAPSADLPSRSFTVRIDLPPNAAVRSGLFGRARFDMGHEEAIVVPETAVFHQGQLAAVYVVDDRRIARFRLVSTGKPHGAGIEILSGLDGGERIVAEKTGLVSDSATVQPE